MQVSITTYIPKLLHKLYFLDFIKFDKVLIAKYFKLQINSLIIVYYNACTERIPIIIHSFVQQLYIFYSFCHKKFCYTLIIVYTYAYCI